jgi:beta-fructofuranosidase
MRHTRRQFLQTAATSATLFPFRNSAFGSLSTWNDAPTQAQLASDPLRPQFHLLPKRNWMNDPDGPIYWNKQYHMFFQYNPNAAIWGDMHWAHAVSPDMVHWKHLPVALAPTPGGYDSEGCFSGSAVNDDGKATFIYTGVKTVPSEQATLRNGTHNFLETQCLATASDSELLQWEKLAQPVLLPPEDPELTGFRDPCLWRAGGKTWFMGIGSGIRGEGGRVLLYRSTDLRKWEYLHPLASGKRNGRETADPVDAGEMWECPDFFALGAKHVLLYSTERKVFWESGEFDSQELVFHPQQHGKLDHGAYYAPKSQLDAKGRRILWGWIPETRSEAEFSAARWAGCISLPRVLSLDEHGTLRMSPIPEISGLRERRISLPVGTDKANRVEASRKAEIKSASAEIALRWSAPALHLQITDGAQDIFSFAMETGSSGKELQVGGSPGTGSLPESTGAHEARIFLDGSVVELFVDGTLAWTARTYRVPRAAMRLEILSNELSAVESLELWPLRAISPDRLTT